MNDELKPVEAEEVQAEVVQEEPSDPEDCVEEVQLDSKQMHPEGKPSIILIFRADEMSKIPTPSIQTLVQQIAQFMVVHGVEELESSVRWVHSRVQTRQDVAVQVIMKDENGKDVNPNHQPDDPEEPEEPRSNIILLS